MPYPNTSGRLPFETASKTGHLPIMSDPLVQRLVQGFHISQSAPSAGSQPPLVWNSFTPADSGIRRVIACDGSYQETVQDGYDLVYIRAGIQRMPVDAQSLPMHPFDVQKEVSWNSDTIQTVLPVEIPCGSGVEFSWHLRTAIFETVCRAKPGLLDTFRWIFSEQWRTPPKAPLVTCPRCGRSWDFSGSDEALCTCGERLYLTDILEWDKDLGGNETAMRPATRFMLVLEFLLLMHCIHQMWQEAPEQLSSTLFLHDGPLSIGGRYTRMIVPLRRFFQYVHSLGQTVYLCGVEKTGLYVNHFHSLNLPPAPDGYSFAVPDHAYIQQVVQGRPITAEHRYGDRHLLGERVFVRLPDDRKYVLTVPSFLEQNLPGRPVYTDLIGLMPILQVLPKLVTPVYDNALFPIVRVNNLVSMANRPSGHMLERFSELLLREKEESSRA